MLRTIRAPIALAQPEGVHCGLAADVVDPPEGRVCRRPRPWSLVARACLCTCLAGAGDVWAVAPAPISVANNGGPPRRWQAGIQATGFSQVSMRDGNVTSTIELASWRGKGPAVRLALWHSSAAAAGSDFVTATAGYNLGAGWTGPLTAQVQDMGATQKRVIQDDGTADTYLMVGTVWIAPAGVYDTLTVDGSGWKLTRKDASYLKFDSAGRVTRVGDSAGLELVVNYATVSGNTRVSSIVDAANRTISFSYSDAITLSSITAPLNSGGDRTWTFSYTANRLSQISDQLGFTIQVAYDTSNRITSVTDRNGIAATIAYGTDHGVLVTDPAPFGSQTQNFDYTGTYSTTRTYKDKRGNTWTYTFSMMDELLMLRDPLNHDQVWSYDTNHNKLTLRNGNSKTWTSTFDTKGNELTRLDPVNNLTSWQYDSTFNKPTKRTDPDEVTPSRRVWDWTYDSATGNLLTESDPLYGKLAPPDQKLTTYAYYTAADNAGKWTALLKSRTDRLGSVTLFEYDDYGQLARMTQDYSTSGGHLNLLTQYENDMGGRRTATVDPRGIRSEYTWDANTRLTKVVVDASTNTGHLNLTTDYDYNSNGDRIGMTKPGNSTGRTVTKYQYDNLRRLTKITEGFGLSGFGFDTTLGYDENSNRTSRTDAEGKVTTWAYDTANRNTSVVDANTQTTSFEYDAANNRTRLIDANTHRTDYTLDDLNRVVAQTVDPTPGLNLVTTYAYSAGTGGAQCGCGGTVGGSNIKRIVDPSGKWTVLRYDLLDRRTQVIRKVGIMDDDADTNDAVVGSPGTELEFAL